MSDSDNIDDETRQARRIRRRKRRRRRGDASGRLLPPPPPERPMTFDLKRPFWQRVGLVIVAIYGSYYGIGLFT
jgi:hypothetical protein